jgi:hypothetical protein
MNKPKKWTEVYPQGTKEGNEEQKFFISLARNPKFEWRSTGMIQKETGLPRKRVEEIIAKYLKAGLIIASPTKEEHWAYWERVPGMLKDTTKSITDKDQNNRIDKQLDGSADMITFGARLFSDAPNANSEIVAGDHQCFTFTAAPFDVPINLQAGEQLSISCTFTLPYENVQITENTIPDKVQITESILPDYIDLSKADIPDRIEIKNEVPTWDFYTALGETIREKYENEYVKVVEVKNVNTRESILNGFPPAQIVSPNVRITDKDL